jgi:protein O-GlcNAc transferase
VVVLPEDGLRQARALAERGETQQAKQLYQAVLEKDPAHKVARDELAALNYRSAQFQALSELFQQGGLEGVVERGEGLVRQYPGAAFLHNILGVAHSGLGNWDTAIACYTDALRIRPDVAETLVNLGKVLSQRKRNDEALACFTKAVRIKPNYADARYSLGLALRTLGRLEEAIACFTKTLEIRPDFAEANDNIGTTLRALGRHDAAIACLETSLKLRPGSAITHVEMAITLAKVERYPESNAAFAAALAIQPTLADPLAQKLYQEAVICDWESLAAETAAIETLGIEGPAIRPFVLLPLEDNPGRHQIRAERFAQERYQPPVLPPTLPPPVKPDRIKIGYFSAAFHNHPLMHLMAKLFEVHDRSRFQVHAYSYGPEADDEMRIRAQKAVEIFRDVRALDGKDIAQLACKDGIDIAIDLMGYTENGRTEIFAHRAAPIQINYLGYPGTMGAPFMDYIVADRILVPEASARFYSEKIITLPHSYMPCDDARQISDRAMTRTEMGLPERGFVFCCFNKAYKIGPEEFAIWMRLLKQVEGSVLWLSETNEWAVGNLKKRAELSGVAAERIVFTERVSMPEHLARHRLADLFLDTFHYNAHSTASDALWAGLPLIAKPGEDFAARVAASVLTALGLPELITDSPEAYERLALELATNRDKLAHLKQKLLAKRSSAPFFKTELFVRHIEDAYAQAYQRFFDGEPPAPLIV